MWHGAGQLAVVGCWVCPNYLWQTWSLCFLQMCLQQTEFCHEVPDGTEAQSSSFLRTISSAKQNYAHCSSTKKSFVFLQASLSLAMILLFGHHTNCLRILFLGCLFLLTQLYHCWSLLSVVMTRYIPEKQSQITIPFFYYGFSFIVDEFVSANIILGGERYD